MEGCIPPENIIAVIFDGVGAETFSAGFYELLD